jgi:hypothetical protein
MFSPDHLAKPRNNDVEKYIEENLCDHQLKWLTMQSRALGYSRIRIFEAILSDWLSRHRERWPAAGVQIVRQAMDEFIFRYQRSSYRRSKKELD